MFGKEKHCISVKSVKGEEKTVKLLTVNQYTTSEWGLHSNVVVSMCYVWVLSGYSGFLPPSKIMGVRLIGDSKLSLGVSVSVHGCLSHLSLCDPVMDCQPVQGVLRLSPNDS